MHGACGTGIIDTTCTCACGVIDTAYLGEFEAEFKKDLPCESGTQGVLFDEKKPRVENLVTLSL
jgi:hypothetical protein